MESLYTWKKYDDAVVTKTHGNISLYRDLYEGNHHLLFERAKDLIAKGEITSQISEGQKSAENVRTPYIVANLSKIIPEITATFVSRSIGSIRSSLKPDEEQNAAANDSTDDAIDGGQGAANEEIVDVQNELIKQVIKNSKLTVGEHWSNVVQQQVDGGLVGVPWKDDNGISIEFKARDTYFPHLDGNGTDLAFRYELEDEKGDKVEYLRVYRERIEEGSLTGQHLLFTLNDGGEANKIPDEEVLDILGIDEVETNFKGRSTSLIEYWANDKTFMNPLGVSVLKGQESKQDEINWTLTRNAIVFERNGKPRIAVSKEVMAELQRIALARYGDDTKIDSRDLEVTTFDDDGNSLEVIQIDISKIGTFENVKNYMKLMLMETQTSEKAIDFYLDGGGGGAASGIAKYYDLLMTLIKSQRISEEYSQFLKNLIESALWLQNKDDSSILIEQPEIEIKDMIPLTRKEILEMNGAAFADGIQSLETTLKNIHPNASDQWIEDELTRIELSSESDDSATLSGGRDFIGAYMDGRTQRGTAEAPPAGTEEE